MSEFVAECRCEWRRLGVAYPIANEMAADLAADLEEAEAEGGSPEDVLGNSAFDPRRFAAAWATSRGVVGSPAPGYSPRWRTSVVFAAVACTGVLAFLAGLVLLSGRSSRSIAFASQVVRRPLPGRSAIPGGIAFPSPRNLPFRGLQIVGVNDFHPLALILLVFGAVGIATAGCAVLYWTRWIRSPRLSKRDHESPTQRAY